jgi:diguanylate cyclase (GGDEF)-like protein
VPLITQAGHRRGLASAVNRAVDRAIDRAGVWPMRVMWLLLGAYLLGLALHGHGFSPLVDGWLGTLTQWAPALICVLAAYRTGFRNTQVLLATAAVVSFASANNYYILALAGASALPFPSPADVGYLLFYPLIFAALIVLVRRQLLRGLAGSMLLDSAVGSLSAASVLAVSLTPVLEAAFHGPSSVAGVVAVAYPLFDLVLVAAVAGIAASKGLDTGRRWILLCLGLLVFTASDIAYALRVAGNAYEVGTPVDAGWAIGLTLIAVWVDGTARPDLAPGHPATGGKTLVVPAVATAAALGVLVMGSRMHVSILAVSLAGATLLLAAMRTQLAFQQLMRMSDVHNQARTDELTGLPNRRALYEDVPKRLLAGEGRRALFLLDLDRFKEVNDSLGHDVGDRLLIQVGVRLTEQLRAGDLLARLGGDEFAILLEGCGHAEAAAMAVRLRQVLAEPFTLEGIALQTDVSIGISLFPDQGQDLRVLLRKADMAMYKAKNARNGHRVYTNADDIHGDDRLRTLQELRQALATDELVLHYQPKIDLATGEVHGVEALVRWNHPSRGLLFPDAFLLLVEESGLMPALTWIVLEKALDQAATWRSEGRALTVAVNMSASCLVDADLPGRIGAMIRARGLPRDVLLVEITEEFLMDDRERARTILARLHQDGVRIAVDDFGTGYSSLAYLRDLPIHELKLDKSFVFPMADDVRAAALVASTIDLAHSLDLRMVAEGVESDLAYAELARYGCDTAQGYLMSRPLPAAELGLWFANRQGEPGLAAAAPVPVPV